MKKTVLLSLFAAAALCADPIFTTTATLIGVNGTTLGGIYTSPYYLELDVAPFALDFPVWCADSRVETGLNLPYTATVFQGDTLFGSQISSGDQNYVADTQTIFNIVALASSAPDYKNPAYSEAIWQVLDPSGWPVTPDVQAILDQAGAHISPASNFWWIEGIGQQPFVAVAPQTPEPGAAWLLVAAGVLFGFSLIRRSVRV